MGYENDSKKAGAQHIWMVELDAPFCKLSFGVGACSASGAAGTECFNTEASCQSLKDFDPEPKTYTHIEARDNTPMNIGAIPDLTGVSITPGELRIGGGLGSRSVVNATFMDHQGSDYGVDKYRETRPYDPLTTGTYWGKWRARNPYYIGQRMRIRTAFLANPADPFSFGINAESRVREYIIEQIQGPDDNGRVAVVGRDVLKMADDDRAVIPDELNTRLMGNTDAAASSIFVMGDVPESSKRGDSPYYIVMGDEIARYTTVTESPLGGYAVGGLQRGQLGTEAQDHDDQTKIQFCYNFVNRRTDYVLREVLTKFAGVPSSFIPWPEWQAEASAHMPANISGLLVSPIGVSDLIAEIAEIAPHQMWWDERENKIRLRYVRDVTESTPTYNYKQHFVEGTFKVKDVPQLRRSLININFDRINPLEGDEPDNHRQSQVRVDAERERQYGGRKIQNIATRWLGQTGRPQAEYAAMLQGRRFSKVLREISFSMMPKDGELWTGDLFRVETPDIQGLTGEPEVVNFQVLSVQEGFGGSLAYKALEQFFDRGVPDPPWEGRFPITIGSDMTAVKIRDLFLDLYSEHPQRDVWPVDVTVEGGVTVMGDRAFVPIAGFSPVPAITVSGFSSDQEVSIEIMQGAIIEPVGGYGGKGGYGNEGYGNGPIRLAGKRGDNGGDGIRATGSNPVVIVNRGYIAAGGGGGGGGAPLLFSGEWVEGAGGGGGAPNAAGGSAGNGNPAMKGSAATATQGGAGGRKYPIESTGGDYSSGGDGGALGKNGKPGYESENQNGGFGGGGTAGYAVRGSNTTVAVNTGTIIGTVQNGLP